MADDAADHDRWIAIFPPETVLLIAGDLCRQRLEPKKDPAVRWAVQRKAAALRRIRKENLINTTR